MERVVHGSTSSKSAQPIESELVGTTEGSAATAGPQGVPFTFMFPELSDDQGSLLEDSGNLLTELANLGGTMHADDEVGVNSNIPAAYTYFLQFLDHDITFTEVDKPDGLSDSEMLAAENLTQWTKDEIGKRVKNKRTTQLQLESVYGNILDKEQPPRIGEEFELGRVSTFGGFPPGKDEFNDLVRSDFSTDPKKDRAAKIGDSRNDSHLLISQIHVAFLRAHNAIVKKGATFDQAKLELQRLYQWMVYHDILPRVVRQKEIDLALADPQYKPANGVPLEFSVGAFRFGHSMIRSSYYLNDDFFKSESLERLFMLIVLSNKLAPTLNAGYPNLPSYRIIEWRKFLEGGRNFARRIRPQMVDPLARILNEANVKVKGEPRLAVQDLKRAYMMRIPSGQALAAQLKVDEQEILKEKDLLDAAVSEKQRQALTSGLLNKTPLWFYVLAEADKVYRTGGVDRFKLGPVGGRLVAEVIIGLIKNFPDSFMNTTWRPSITNKETFMLSDFLQLAGVLEQ